MADATRVDPVAVEKAILAAGGIPDVMAPYIEKRLAEMLDSNREAEPADVIAELKEQPALWPMFGDKRPRRSTMSTAEKAKLIRRIGLDAYLELER